MSAKQNSWIVSYLESAGDELLCGMREKIVCAKTKEEAKKIIESKNKGVVGVVRIKSKTICQTFDGCRCNICGGYFSDGDLVCSNGHELGCEYYILA